MNARFEVIILPQAESDSQQIYDWLFERSPQGAESWYQAFNEAVENIGGRVIMICMDTKALSTEIRRSKAQRARLMSLDERLTAGAKLYAEQWRLARSLVSGLNPTWADAQVDAEMFRREDLIRQRNTKKFYRPVISMDDQPVKPS